MYRHPDCQGLIHDPQVIALLRRQQLCLDKDGRTPWQPMLACQHKCLASYGNMACCMSAVPSGCPIMMFRFCSACPAAPLTRLSNTAASTSHMSSVPVPSSANNMLETQLTAQTHPICILDQVSTCNVARSIALCHASQQILWVNAGQMMHPSTYGSPQSAAASGCGISKR